MRLNMLMSAAVFAACAGSAATVTLPVDAVKGVADRQERVYPAKVVAVERVDLTPEVSGDIVEVCFTNGAIVKANDVLYKLMPVKYTGALKNAQAKVADAKAKAEYAESNLKRYESVKENAVSRDKIETAQRELAVAKASLEAAEADLAVADYNLRRCSIRSPITGKTGSTRLTKGNPASPATPLVTIVQIQPIRVRFSISNGDFLTMFGGRSRRLREQGEVEVTLANGATYEEKGEVEYTENIADESTDTIQVFATFPNAERILKPGGTVGVTLRSKTGVETCAVPPSAVMQDAQGAYVWALDAEGRASRRSIVRGRLAGDVQFVSEGLKVGERVVVDGTHKVAAGDIVTPAK